VVVSESSTSSLRKYFSFVVVCDFEKDFTCFGIFSYGSEWNVENDIDSVFSMFMHSLSILAIFGENVFSVFEVKECPELFVSFKDDVSSSSSVTAVGSAESCSFISKKVNCAGSSIARAAAYFNIIYKTTPCHRPKVIKPFTNICFWSCMMYQYVYIYGMRIVLHLLERVGLFLRFWFRARGARWLHSPFHFSLYGFVKGYVLPLEVSFLYRKYRAECMLSNRFLVYSDPGAGSYFGGYKKGRYVSELVRRSTSSEEKIRIMCALISYSRPSVILELGTNLGFSSGIFSKVFPGVLVHTVEGAESVLEEARNLWEKLGVKPESHYGLFEDILPELLPTLSVSGPMFVLIDGNHRYAPTLSYFRMLLPYVSEGSTLVFDDIQWSVEMRRVWDEIKSQLPYGSTVETSDQGWVFMRRALSREDFVLRI
jgi:predicted O-methyltransferase YrrM